MVAAYPRIESHNSMIYEKEDPPINIKRALVITGIALLVLSGISLLGVGIALANWPLGCLGVGLIAVGVICIPLFWSILNPPDVSYEKIPFVPENNEHRSSSPKPPTRHEVKQAQKAAERAEREASKEAARAEKEAQKQAERERKAAQRAEFEREKKGHREQRDAYRTGRRIPRGTDNPNKSQASSGASIGNSRVQGKVSVNGRLFESSGPGPLHVQFTSQDGHERWMVNGEEA